MWGTGMLAQARRTEPDRESGPIDDAYDAWREADAAARAFERDVSETWKRYERGVGAPPTKGLLREAAWLRHTAREKLSHVIGLLHVAGHIQPAGAARAPKEMPSLSA